MDPVSLDTTIPNDQPVSIDTASPGNPAPSGNTADIRADKASIGIGALIGKSKAEIQAGLMRGDEQSIRIQAAQRLDQLQEQDRQDKLIDIVRKNNGTLTMDQMDALRVKPNDPASVFEDQYAKKFLDGIYDAGASIGDTALDAVSAQAPDTLNKDMAKAADGFSNIEYAKTKLQDAEDIYHTQGWVPWVIDQAKNVVPFYSDVKLRGNVEGVPAFNWQFQGENLRDQTRAMLRLPGDQFRSKYDEVFGRLTNDNPTLALQWANAVVGMSTSDAALADVNNIIDLTGLPGLAKGVTGALKSVNTVRTALKDGIQGAATVRPGAGQVAESFGDTATAAVQKTSEIVQDKIDGTVRPASNTANVNTINDPIRRAKEALPTNFILDKADIAANPGPLSRELTNRILQQQDVASGAIVDVIQNVAKVQRIPLEEATPAVMAVIKEEVKNQNPGIKNAILDVGDPVYNPLGNNYNFPVRIGNWTGEQFSSEEVARKFAKEHGILEYDIHGEPGLVHYIPESAVKRPWESESRLGSVSAKEGELRVHTDDGARVETTTKPAIGHIPVTIDSKGGVKFHPTITSEEGVAKAAIQQQGLGFHLITWKPLDETQPVLKELTLELASTKSVASRQGVEAWGNTVFGAGYARSSDNTLSPFEVHQRKTAAYSPSNYQAVLQSEMKHVEDIARGRVRVDPVTGQAIGAMRSYLTSIRPANKLEAKKTYSEFNRALDFARTDKNPTTGVVGYFKKSPGEINELYLQNFQRPATFQEIQGYLAFVRNYENDRVFRSVREYTNKVRLGAEQHQVTFVDHEGNKLPSGFFDAVSKKELPGGEYPLLDLTGDKPVVRLASKMGSDFKVKADLVRRGENVVSEIYNPELRPMKSIPGVGETYVRYVLSKSGARETKGLDWNQVNRLSGGHFEYDYANYLKEANIRKDTYGGTTIHRYEGDKTFGAVANRAQGRQWATVLNEVKARLVKGDVNGAKDVFNNGLKGANGPAMEWKEFLARTRPMKVDGVMRPPSIDIHEPFYVVPKGKSIYDLDKSLEDRYSTIRPNGTRVSTFQDGTKSGSLARQYQVGYTQERDNQGLMALNIEGTKNNPIYKYEPAKFVDPIATMNRALNQIVNSTFMDDMKIAGMENWLREAEGSLKADKSEIRSAPFYHFNNATDRSAFKPAADPTVVANLLSNRFKTKQFLGVPSRYDMFLHDTSQKIADWMWEHEMNKDTKLGSNGVLIPTWLLGQTASPVSMLRSMAYHAKIGLFALPQILTQMQSYVTIASVAPRSTVGGTWAATLHQWSRFAKDPAFIDKLDEMASKANIPGFHQWKPGFFKEAMTELDNRGFANVGGEYSTLDTQFKHHYIKNETGAFLDLGQTFFKNTEQHVRFGAWYTAALEYQAEHPSVKVMRRTDWDKVLDRADDLSGNMSRASSSILQSGPLSLTGQFLTYQMHLAELFWGSRIGGETGSPMAARLRMYVAYSALFGAPMGIGISGLPVADYFRKAAIDNGYVVGDNWITSAVMEGLPAVFGAWATSPKGDLKDGNWYNFSKFGAGGFTQLNQLMSDGSFWNFIGGASTSIMANTIKNASGFVRSLASMMPGSAETPAFPMKIDDWIDIFKEITSVNQAYKAIIGVAYGKWLSKNEAYQADVSKGNALFMAGTGLDLTNAADNYNVGQLLKDQTEAQKQALNLFIREFRRGVMSADNNDWGNYNAYMTRAFGYLSALNYPEDKMDSAFAIAAKGHEDRISSIREQFYTKNVPAGKEDQRMDAYTRFLRTQQGQ